MRSSLPTWRAASPSARPAGMPSRAASQAGSRISREATPVSWACPFTRPRSCCCKRACGSETALPMPDILINWTPQETRVAIVEAGAVQELHVERALERGLVGNIYLGKVARVLPGMQSSFVDIGLDRAAFLHV